MANRRRSPLFYPITALTAAVSLILGTASLGHADDATVISNSETTTVSAGPVDEGAALVSAEETLKQEVLAAADTVVSGDVITPTTPVTATTDSTPAPAAVPDSAFIVPIPAQPAADAIATTPELTGPAVPQEGVPATDTATVIQAPTFSLEAQAIPSQTYGTGFFAIQQTNPLAANAHQLTATITGNGSFVRILREKTTDFPTDANHGGFTTEYVTCEPFVLLTVTNAAGEIVASVDAPGNTAPGSTVLPRFCPNGVAQQPDKQIVMVTPEEPSVIYAGEGIRGSVTLKETPGIIYTVTPAGATEGNVTVSFAAAPETATVKYVLAGSQTTPWMYDLGTYKEPKPLEPNPGFNPDSQDSYSEGSFAVSSGIGDGKLVAKGKLARELNVSFVLNVEKGLEQIKPQEFGSWNGTTPLVLTQVDLSKYCGTTIGWTWLRTDTSNDASSQLILFSGSIDLPACPSKPSDGQDDSENGDGKDGHKDGGQTPDDGNYHNGGHTPDDGDRENDDVTSGDNHHENGGFIPGTAKYLSSLNIVGENRGGESLAQKLGVNVSTDAVRGTAWLPPVAKAQIQRVELAMGRTITAKVLANTGIDLLVAVLVLAFALLLAGGAIAYCIKNRHKMTFIG